METGVVRVCKLVREKCLIYQFDKKQCTWAFVCLFVCGGVLLLTLNFGAVLCALIPVLSRGREYSFGEIGIWRHQANWHSSLFFLWWADEAMPGTCSIIDIMDQWAIECIELIELLISILLWFSQFLMKYHRSFFKSDRRTGRLRHKTRHPPTHLSIYPSTYPFIRLSI